MRRRPVSVGAVLALLCLSVLVTGTSSPAAAPAAAVAAPPPAVLQSNWELATGNRLTRDCGVSAPLPDRPDLSLWLFCDIEMREADGDPLPFPFRPGTFASVGPAVPGEVPDGLSEVPSPPAAADITAPSDRAPQPFLPGPTGLTMPDGTPCGAAGSDTFATVRPRGIAQVPPGTAKLRLFDGSTEITVTDPSSLLFVVYADICGRIVAGPTVEEHVKRVGVAVYDPAANRFVARLPVFDAGAGPSDLPWYQNLWHPVIGAADPPTSDGFARNVDLFLVASTCDTIGGFGTCAAGRVYLARGPLADGNGHSGLYDAPAYRYWNPGQAGVALEGPSGVDHAQTGWTTADAAASILPPGTGLGPVHAYIGDLRWPGRQTDPAYAGRGEGLVMVEQYSVAGHYRIWQASTPTGPWTLKGSGVTPCLTGTTTLCGPLVGHPELSTLGQVLVSQARVPAREVEVVAAAAPQVVHAPPGGWVTSNWERARMQDIRRECGWSAPLPANPAGESVWVFCDMAPTFDAGADPHSLPYIGTFMGVAPTTPGQVPTALSDGPGARCVDPDPAVGCGGSAPAALPARPNNNGPGFLLRNQPGLPGQGGQPCGADLDGDGDGDSAHITWAWGVTRGPAGPLTIDPSNGPPRTVPDGSQLLVLPYNEVCADTTAPPGTLGAIHPKRTGIAIYEPATNTVLAQTTIFGPPAPGGPAPSEPWAPGDLDWPYVLAHPVFQGGYMYLFSAECDTFVDPYDPAEQGQPCPSGKVMAARVPAGQIQDGAAYRWHTGAPDSNTWTSTNDPALATSILPPTPPVRGPVGFGGTIYVGDYSALGKGLLLLEPTSWAGHYRIWQSASVGGPWTLVRGEGLMPGCAPDAFGQPRTPAACYNFGGHPELSPLSGPNAEHIYVSHIQPDISWSDDDTNQYEVEVVDIGTVPDL